MSFCNGEGSETRRFYFQNTLNLRVGLHYYCFHIISVSFLLFSVQIVWQWLNYSLILYINLCIQTTETYMISNWIVIEW